MRPGPIRSALSARLAPHPRDRGGDDGQQEDVEQDGSHGWGHPRGHEASEGRDGRGGGPDDKSDAQVHHAVTQVGDRAGDAGGNHDKQGRAARDQVASADGKLHAGHDDGSAAHADQTGEDARAQAHEDRPCARGWCQGDDAVARGDVQVLGDDDKDRESDEDPGQDGRGEAPQEPHADLGARERADDEEGGARPGDLAVQGVGARADGCGDDDGGKRRRRGAALVHAQDGHEGGHDDEATTDAEESGEEACADARRNDEKDAARRQGLGVCVGHISTVVSSTSPS